MRGDSARRNGTAGVLLSLLCVLLILLAAAAQVNHVHPDNSKTASHECSICSVAHSGAFVNAVYQPVPVFVPSVLAPRPQELLKPFFFVSHLYIRPPPSV